jgi:protein-S-isoprenylcysteine O-methyltransferase Ste14
MRIVAPRLVVDALIIAIALFGSASTLEWRRAWVLLTVLFVIRMIGALVVFRAHPALLLERAKPPIHAGQPRSDRFLVLAVLATGFVGLPIIAGLDRFRWQAMSPPSSALSALGLVMFVAGWTIKSLALWANAFAVATIRIQREREHAVVDTGVYRIVRHPFYAADPLIFVGLGLWLESYLAVLCSVIPIGLLLWRIRVEEQVLRRDLQGYNEYATRVPHRLLPGIW